VTPAEFADAMRLITKRYLADTEAMHWYADEAMVELLRNLGFGEAMDVYEAMSRWYA